ncbi:AAA-domain-containing protein [Neolentinus lepideus HHB14362 ss-1]|uniref:Peroxisomal ATPase PEX6 n=1 Tax=Neolentinus lepideus HHB14362 ss-1 TaxID=1314782 RepID=A0A165USB3_9AGAM|nr:AAA-domain-containing protein [Neolentinus lepideus HHB14362 ss-1]
MSLFFNKSAQTVVSVSLKSDVSKGGPDTVLVGRQIRYRLTGTSDHAENLVLSITPVDGKNVPFQGSLRSTLKTLLCHAEVDDEFSITLAKPSPLSQVFIVALSEDAYDAARDLGSFLEDWLYADSRILRQGDDMEFNHGHDIVSTADFTLPYRYRLVMTEPVMQGKAEKGTTQIVLLRPSVDPADLSNGHATPSEFQDTPTGSTNGSRESLMIDERFLAGSLVDIGLSFYSSNDVNGLVNGNAYNGAFGAQGLALLVNPLSDVVSPVSDDYTVYINTVDLCHIGLLNGDWAMASSCAIETNRIVRLCVDDELVRRPGSVTVSPILLRNILRESVHWRSANLRIRLAPLGYARPVIPVADEVTIARVASPITVQRAFQPLVLRSLKDYFVDNARLVREGDVIATAVNTDCLSRLEYETSSNEIAEEEEEWTHLENLENTAFRDELVFFVVTRISCGGPSNGPTTSNGTSYSTKDGELGCWVDTSMTKMVQAGVEHLHVPDIAVYMGIEPGETGLPYTTGSPRQQPDKGFNKLYSLSSVAFTTNTRNYDIRLSIILKGARGAGKLYAAREVARRLGIHLLDINCFDILGESDIKTEGALRAQFDKAASCAPCVMVLRDIDAFSLTAQSEPEKDIPLASALRECISEMYGKWQTTGHPILVYGTTGNADHVPTSLLSCFKHEVDFEAPDETSRLELINSLVAQLPYSPDISLKDIAKNTAAFVANDIVDLILSSKISAIQRVKEEKSSSTMSELLLLLAGLQMSAEDLNTAIAKARAAYSESIGTPKIPNVTWDDVGGLVSVKTEILETIQLPLEHPDLFAGGLKKRSGILLYGPPGTGKTLLAKAVATSCSLNFFSVKGPELLNMYIGESEANVRRVFQQARDAKPCVIFFDELDSVAPKRGNHGDSGGVMDRIVSQLLAELDGISGDGSTDLFVIGATNRPDLLEPALLRPGRFDRLIYLSVSTTHDAQLDIMKALTRNFKLHPSLDLRSVAEQCPFTYTGADFYALCSDAMLNAMSRKAGELDAKIAVLNQSPSSGDQPYPLTPQYYLAEMAQPEDIEVVVMPEDFDKALRSLVPSVSQSEMDHYQRVQSRFSRGSQESSVTSRYRTDALIKDVRTICLASIRFDPGLL